MTFSQPQTSERRKRQVWGYVPEYDRTAAWASVRSHAALLTGISLFQYGLEPDGRVKQYPGLGPAPLAIRETGIHVVPMVTNLIGGQWDRARVAGVLTDPQVRQAHLQHLVALVVDGRYPGLELDYENLSADDREPYSAFIAELAAALHARGKTLSLAVHAKLVEPGPWPGAQAQDWSNLGTAADRIVVMTYDENPSRPGPIASVSWSRDILQFALSRIPAERVFQGIPFYGYDWSGSEKAEYRTYRDLIELARAHGVEPHREASDRHMVLQYTRSGAAHEVWIPDGETVSALMAVGQELGVAGYAIWRMGGEDPLVWPGVQRAISTG